MPAHLVAPVSGIIFGLFYLLIAGLRSRDYAYRSAVHDRAGGAGLDAFGIAATQITFDDLASRAVVVHGTVGAGHCAYFAANAFVVNDLFGAGCFVYNNGIGWAGMQTPGFLALGTGVRNGSFTVFEFKHLDT